MTDETPAVVPAEVATKPRASTGGIVATIILSVLLLIYTILMASGSLLLGFASDGCTGQCDDNGIEAGILVAFFGCLALGLVGLVFGIVWAARRRRFGWIFPIVAGLLEIVAYVVGLVITSGAAHVSLS